MNWFSPWPCSGNRLRFRNPSFRTLKYCNKFREMFEDYRSVFKTKVPLSWKPYLNGVIEVTKVDTTKNANARRLQQTKCC